MSMALDLSKLTNKEKKQLLINRLAVATKMRPDQIVSVLNATKQVLAESCDIIGDLLGVQSGMVSILMKKLTGGKDSNVKR